MKTKWIKQIARFSGLAIALALFAGGIVEMNAQEKGSARGGAHKLTQAKPIKTVDDLSAVQPGDMIVMSCPKCKNVAVSHVEPTFKAMQPKEGVKTQHTCPGCETTIEVKGHGKSKQQVLKHVCQKCGSKSAFCCVVKKGAGPTPGMEKEQ